MSYEPALIADIHTHVLPGVDHGAKGVKDSIEMLRESYNSGIRYVCATHHYNVTKESPEEFVKRRNEAAKLLSESSVGIDIPALALGAEFTYFKNMSSFFDLFPLCIGKSRYILIEPPYTAWENSFFEEVEQIILRQELVPIIAHAERYTKVAPKNYTAILTEIGAVLQYNAEHFMRFPKHAIKRIPKNATVVFGSDMHNMTDRAPNLAPTLVKCERFMPESFFESARTVTEKIFGGKA